MRKLALVFVLFLTACATIQNPINTARLTSVESAYGVALSAAVGYYELYKVNRCTTSRPESPTNFCARRSVIVALQQADLKAQAAMQAARRFVIQNPTLDASFIITAAEAALSLFQAIEQQNGIKS